MSRRRKPVGADDGVLDPEQEIRINMWQRKRLIPPDSHNKKQWELVLLTLTAYSCLELPLLWAFSVDPSIAQLVRCTHTTHAWCCAHNKSLMQ